MIRKQMKTQFFLSSHSIDVWSPLPKKITMMHFFTLHGASGVYSTTAHMCMRERMCASICVTDGMTTICQI